MNVEDKVAAHYGRGELTAVIVAALQHAGKDVSRLRPADLAGVDEFHVRGAEATDELIARMDLDGGGHRVLDVGCGLGGATRRIAQKSQREIVGVDLTAQYCDCAAELAQLVGLGDRVRYRQASALALPFADAHFDRVITQHVALNIPDKAAFYAEVHRVLEPGGSFGIYDLLQGPGGEVHFPVPWAKEASTSFLVTPEEMRRLLVRAGFEVVHWRDTSEEVAPGSRVCSVGSNSKGRRHWGPSAARPELRGNSTQSGQESY